MRIHDAWHSLVPILGDTAYDETARLADRTLTATGLERLAQQLSSETLLSEAPELSVPVAHPGKILCLGKNYRAHAEEFGAEPPTEPMFFNKLPECLLAPGGTIELPPGVGRVDHEGELCLVIGAVGRDVTQSEATHLVAGLTLINDVTARNLQSKDRERRFPWLRCKSFDTFGPCGPCVIPFEDAFDDVRSDGTPDLAIEVLVNGEVRQSSRTSMLVHRIAPTLAFLSRHTTLRPGDLIATGTPAGVSALSPGDTVEVRCERIGSLVNQVASRAI
jgi:2-keto-4-pentenoate hydratase/2-oxohepta-3-ene-1,7-dioic acid hydratase in catechol pathway